MRKQTFAVLVALATLVPLSGCGGGSGPAENPEDYPSKTVTLVCPWAPGGGTDRVSRFWADALQKEFGQPFVVVNKTGGSGAVGHSAGAYARPDGYTMTIITFELSTMHHMGICDLTYEDFAGVMQVNGDAAAILVQNDASWKTLPEFLDFAKQNPGKVKMSGTATGGAWDLARAGLQLAADVPVQSIVWVPTDGAAPSLVQLLGGHIDAVCCSVPEAAAQIEAGQLRVLTVMDNQSPADFPGLPTTKEAEIDWRAVGWRGLAVPKDTPAGIVARLEQACKKIADSDEYSQFMQKNGFAIVLRDKVEFRSFLAEQDEQWKQVITAAGYAQ